MSLVQEESNVSILLTVSFKACTSDWMFVMLANSSDFTACSSVLMLYRFSLRAACSLVLKIAPITMRSDESSLALKSGRGVLPAGLFEQEGEPQRGRVGGRIRPWWLYRWFSFLRHSNWEEVGVKLRL